MKTTRAILVQLQQGICDEYAKQLAALPMQKKTREILIDGHTDGVRQGIQHTVKMLGVEVEE